MHKYIFLILLLSGCKKTDLQKIPSQINTFKCIIENSTSLKKWEDLDIINDSIPGISLDKSHKAFNHTEKNEVIIALIDDGVDFSHIGIKDNIWVNPDEIPDNKIDDDNNGYIDDVNGWNFSGLPNGESNKYRHYDYVRFVIENRNYLGNDSLHLTNEDLADRLFIANEKLKRKIQNIDNDIEYANNLENWKNEARDVLIDRYKFENFDLNQLDSLNRISKNDSIVQIKIKILTGFLKNGFTDDYINGLQLKSKNARTKLLNIDFNERFSIGDNPNDIDDIKYGNPNIDSDVKYYPHGTIVAGLLSKNNEHIKIMPLALPGFGDKHDKDIALAIRYAVDNGAKVINMSFGKDYSVKKSFVDDAIKYAEDNNVIIITSAGNGGHNMDNPNKYNYPDDRNSSEEEFVKNFLKVGGTSFCANENLLYEYSNYGRENVDLFAPAVKIYTTYLNDSYKNDTGTSLSAALTSHVAALIYSNYPKLSASQVKHILMDSGVKYTFDVKVGDTLLPFNTLSKSGKILNAYNAMIMADSISNE